MLSKATAIATLACVDLVGMRQFYGEKLGLSQLDLPGIASDQDQAVAYQLGQGSILFIYARPAPTKADHTAATFIIDDFDGTIADLLSRGITFARYELPEVEYDDRGVAMIGELQTAWFSDPEGNILAVAPAPFQNM